MKITGIISLAFFCALLTGQTAYGLTTEEEFGKQAKEYEQLFNDGNAAALADLWSEDGAMQTGDGTIVRGRKEIQDYFQKYFAQNGKNRQLKVTITSLKEPGTGVVIEEGITSGGSSGDSKAKYTVVHYKGPTGWKMAWVSESHISEHAVKIKDFEWLCGKWQANASKGPVTMQAHLMDNGHFIECTTSGADGKNTSRQIIGYNPRLETLTSFHFDSSGGMGRGQFRKVNGVWRQLCTGILPDGTECTSINTMTPSSKDSITWRSIERTVGGVRMPDSEIVVLKRIADTTGRSE